MTLKEKLEEIFAEEKFPMWGIIASITVLTAFLLTAIFYTGRWGEPYSLLNHAISELGEWGVSELAVVFNIGLIISGLFYLFLINGLGNYIENKVSKVAKILGLFSAISLICVGIFAMNFMAPHYIAAMAFFYGGMVTVGLMTVAILIQEDEKIPKPFAIAGIMVVAIFAIFLFFPLEFNFITIGDFSFMRPTVILLFLFEWAVAISIIGFLLLISIYLFFKK